MQTLSSFSPEERDEIIQGVAKSIADLPEGPDRDAAIAHLAESFREEVEPVLQQILDARAGHGQVEGAQ